MIGYLSAGIGRIPHLQAFLGAPCAPARGRARELTHVVGWGLKPTAEKARRYARRRGLPYISLEDGFIRSLGLGVDGAPAHSLVVDRTGIYYDATRPSDLETLIHQRRFSDDELERARACMALIRRYRLSKYNHAPAVLPGDGDLLPFASGGPSGGGEARRVLVVDQTVGDASIEYGLADAHSFERMLDAAVADNPGSEIWVKTHPDVLTGKKAGHLSEMAAARGLRLLADDLSPWVLIERVDTVYVVTSQLGFEALIAGKTVRCFGMPFYAGWGLTRDDKASPRRGVARSLEQVFAAAYLEYCRYVNPYTGRRCELEDTIALIADQKRVRERYRGDWLAVGMSAHKRRFLKRFLGSAANITFCPASTFATGNLGGAGEESGSGTGSIDAVPSWAAHADAGLFVHGAPRAAFWRKMLGSLLGASGLTGRARREASAGALRGVLSWGARTDSALERWCLDQGVALHRVEDGFVRSVGLGVDLVDPLSLVIDSRGIYYDASRTSDLEALLVEGGFSADLVGRAARLRERLVERKLSKYNVGSSGALDIPRDRRVILVPGQVETDASIATGATGIRTNRALLQAVREAEPDGYIIYKPHPDVTGGGRRGAVSQPDRWCDREVTDVAMPRLLEQVDAVHTMTSLTGFEALLRGVPVVTYGLPFYAGWGLTEDRVTCARRHRRVSLDELVAASLVLYPVYVDPRSGDVINAETAVDLLASQRDAGYRVSLKSRVYRLVRRRT